MADSEASSLSFDSDADDDVIYPPWYGLVRGLSRSQLEQLEVIFQEQKIRQKLSKKDAFGLSKDEFVAAFDEICETEKQSFQAALLFEEIPKTDDRKLTWRTFLDFLVDNYVINPQQKLSLRIENTFPVPHVKREPITTIVAIQTANHFCYAVVGKYGRVGLYNGRLDFLTSYDAMLSTGGRHLADGGRTKNRWITDAIYCGDLQLFLVASSCRNVTVYEASGLKHEAIYHVASFPNVPTCLCYSPVVTDDSCQLFVGCDDGGVLLLRFLQPRVELLRRKDKEKLTVYYWIEISEPNDHVTASRLVHAHNSDVRRLHYNPSNESLISCSRDPVASVINQHVRARRKAHVFKMKRGANCFAYSEKLKLLVTGSGDGCIRLWDPIRGGRAVHTVRSHEGEVIDLKVLEEEEMLMSCCSEATLKLWNLKDLSSVQTLNINFNCFKIPGRKIEWGSSCIYPGPATTQQTNPADVWRRPHLLVSCSNYLSKIRVNRGDDFDDAPPPLPPPPLQNSVLLPNFWKITDESDVEALLSPSDSPPLSCDVTDGTVEERLRELRFVLDRDILNEFNLRNDINYKIAALEIRKLKMRESVANGAPYLALELHDVPELTLPADVATPRRRCDARVASKIRRLLSDASSKDVIFSEASSTSATSGRSWSARGSF